MFILRGEREKVLSAIEWRSR